MIEKPTPFDHIELKIIEAGFDAVDSNWHRFITFFPYYRIYYVVSGHAVIYLQDQQLELSPGKMYFIPALSIFDAHCDKILRHYWIHFNFDITTNNYLTIYKPLNVVQAPPLTEELFSCLVSKINSDKKDSPAELLACEGLLKYLLSFFLSGADTEATPEAARFIPVLQYIDTNFNSHITNNELSSIMYLSSTYFSNLFTKQFGITPQQYIQQKRMNKAALLLLESNKNIREIAFTCGFESEAYFNRSFHKFMGISPGRYRKLVGHFNSTSK